MTAKTVFDQFHASDRLAMVFDGARRTDDQKFRSRLLAVLDDAIHSSKSVPFHGDAREVISNCSGTTLEPFTIRPGNLDLVARFTQLCLTGSDQNRTVRLVSEESLGDRGGLVLDRDLNSRYLERFAENDRHHDYHAGSFWTMDECVRGSELERFALSCQSAVCVPDEESGFRIDIHCLDKELAGWVAEETEVDSSGSYGEKLKRAMQDKKWLADNILENSSAGEGGHSLESLGMQCRVSSKDSCRISILPSSPEATVRFSALLATGALLTIGPFENTRFPTQVKLQLNHPLNDAIVLPCEVSRLEPVLTHVMRADIDFNLDLKHETAENLFKTLGVSLPMAASIQENP